MSKYWCRWCGLEKDFEDRNYEVGLMLAENQSLDAPGHTEDVTPYLICKKCAERIEEEFRIAEEEERRIAEEEHGRNLRDAFDG